MYAEHISVGKHLCLGPSARVEADAISQPYMLMNDFTGAASQKFKLCSSFMQQEHIMISLDKLLFRPTSSNFQAPSMIR